MRKPLTYEDKQTLARYISRWKEQGVYKGYLKMYVENNRKRSYDDFLFIMMLYYFIMKKKKLVPLTMTLAREVAKDMKEQARFDIKEGTKDKEEAELPDASEEAIDEAMRVDAYNCSFDEYMELKLADDAQRAMVRVRGDMVATDTFHQELFQEIMKDMAKEFVHWRLTAEGRSVMSGSVVQSVRSFANRIYLWFIRQWEALRRRYGRNILFVAEMDDRTTRMCRSLNGQRFRAHGLNTFRRYSAYQNREVRYSCFGMVAGLNLPPITDHFHWCRSRIVFMESEGENAEEEERSS